jgi:hypothetical protein
MPHGRNSGDFRGKRLRAKKVGGASRELVASPIDR